jgi:AraC family transcriptional regulator, regulatory protein of adaptative response / DNA-3-methyladenine glycosylase II
VVAAAATSDSRESTGRDRGRIECVELDFDRCYRAVDSRDQRFDGWFYTAVTSTGIYCRPSCPAITPKRENVRFYPSAAAAQRAGFRACRRCRPDAAPGSPEWDARADTVGRAMRLIRDGVVDREGVPGLASRLGYTERHLHRMLSTEVGAGPLALARAQRAQSARILVETTEMGLAEIAFAAGFGSVRQFNDTIREVYGCPPSTLRDSRRRTAREAGVIGLRLAYRPPLHASSLLEFLGCRAIPGVEEVDDTTYRRRLRLPSGTGTVALTPGPAYVTASLRLADVRDLAPAVARSRRVLDLDADPEAVDAALAEDPALAPLIRKEPGVRVPRAVDGFEIAVRAVVGQQISVPAARKALARLVNDRGFPTAGELLALPDQAFGMPAARRGTLRGLARAVVDGRLDLDPGADREELWRQLTALPGVGAWTAGYVTMRAAGDPDAFLPTDVGVRRGAAAVGLPDDPKALEAHAERWRPWRSYALIRLWRQA